MTTPRNRQSVRIRMDALEAENERLRVALRSFVAWADEIQDHSDGLYVEPEWIGAARAALNADD